MSWICLSRREEGARNLYRENGLPQGKYAETHSHAPVAVTNFFTILRAGLVHLTSWIACRSNNPLPPAAVSYCDGGSNFVPNIYMTILGPLLPIRSDQVSTAAACHQGKNNRLKLKAFQLA